MKKILAILDTMNKKRGNGAFMENISNREQLLEHDSGIFSKSFLVFQF